MKLSKIAGIALVGAFAASVTGSVLAATKWQANHPRRVQVNSRLKNQNRRINNEVRNGQITRGQAQQMHREDRQIRGEERAMASQNGSHLTKGEQATLNQQENGVSHQIGR